MHALTLAQLSTIRGAGIEDAMRGNVIANYCRTRYKLFADKPLRGMLHRVIVKVGEGVCGNNLEKWL